MTAIKHAFWAIFVATTLFWLLAEPAALLQATGFLQYRALFMQWSGLMAIAAMSIAMLLAIRPVWLESSLGGLDKMYRLHKWLGIAALVFSLLHWLLANAPKWAAQLGLITGRRPGSLQGEADTIQWTLQSLLSDLRGPAEAVGEWAFYLAVVLIVLALVKTVPYRLFAKLHRVFPLLYLALAFHSLALVKFDYWSVAIGWLTVLLLVVGSVCAVISLLGLIGVRRQTSGTVIAVDRFNRMQSIAVTVKLAKDWHIHRAGQFAFLQFSRKGEAHPFTIASDWDEQRQDVAVLIKALGDDTTKLQTSIEVGQAVRLEGPYGCFDFADNKAEQIWISGGIGMTPFLARMQALAAADRSGRAQALQVIHYFASADTFDSKMREQLQSWARAAGIKLHMRETAKEGHLTLDQIVAVSPSWRQSSIWFCGPAAFAAALQARAKVLGLPWRDRFHHEFFAFR